jgi:hypothetical protein
VIRRSRESGNPEKSGALDSSPRGTDEFFELPYDVSAGLFNLLKF